MTSCNSDRQQTSVTDGQLASTYKTIQIVYWMTDIAINGPIIHSMSVMIMYNYMFIQSIIVSSGSVVISCSFLLEISTLLNKVTYMYFLLMEYKLLFYLIDHLHKPFMTWHTWQIQIVQCDVAQILLEVTIVSSM